MHYTAPIRQTDTPPESLMFTEPTTTAHTAPRTGTIIKKLNTYYWKVKSVLVEIKYPLRPPFTEPSQYDG